LFFDAHIFKLSANDTSFAHQITSEKDKLTLPNRQHFRFTKPLLFIHKDFLKK